MPGNATTAGGVTRASAGPAMRDAPRPPRDRVAGARGRERATAIEPGGDLQLITREERKKIILNYLVC